MGVDRNEVLFIKSVVSEPFEGKCEWLEHFSTRFN